MAGKQIPLAQLVELLSAKFDGDPAFVIKAAGTIRECKRDWITFVIDKKHFQEFEASDVQVAIVSHEMPPSTKMTLRVENVVAAFAQTVRLSEI